jgi:DnaJ family protein B protein 12
MPTASSSGADASNGGAARNREHSQGNQERKFTVEQKEAVLRIRRCKATAFYDILGLETVRTTCTDAEIKKAYRKQSLLTHPDKNGHEHADEAFKMVARAFSVLGDKEKREKFDRFGTDPDSRFASAQAQNPFAGGFANRGGGMAGGAGGGNMWEDEISPEEMFARFFGGGGPFGGPFGGGRFFSLPSEHHDALHQKSSRLTSDRFAVSF